MSFSSFRRERISRPLFKLARQQMPSISDTERDALEAGDIWFDRELFSGNPDWQQLLNTAPAHFSDREQAFIDGPVQQLCAMLDDWEINWQHGDLPEKVWDFMKSERFFAMIIPEQYGGLGFSAFANSEVVRRISTRSVAAAVTVMVPNSLGPGELLMEFGTEQQQQHWLPRLADGREIPCFGLTSPEAGSDAASMLDHGVICEDEFNGVRQLGIRLNWHKRYITLGPVATVLGLAFKLYDPDQLLGEQEQLGITVALIPTDLDGVSIGQRHLPAYQMFQNGPNQGKDVFIPMDYVIGEQDGIGKGWKMLMTALGAGRGISLPSLSAAAAAYCARTSGAYARVRQQFGIPISKFEGIQERLGDLAANAYCLDAARRLTCAGLDQGLNLSVISAIIKAHATYRMRDAVDHAMDIHAGKAVIDGPGNYLGNLHRAVPVGITVEGANILTRSLIIFGQGAIRCHPYLLDEMLAFENSDEEQGLDAFDRFFWQHIWHTSKNAARAWWRNWSFGLLSPAPAAGKVKRHYRQLSRYSAAFAVLADAALLVYGGDLKRKEMMSARLGDILSELFFLSATLKRWHDEGRRGDDLPLVDYSMAKGRASIEHAIQGVLKNLANRPLAWLLTLLVQPLGVRQHGPDDALTQQCAKLLLKPGRQRDRITAGLYLAAGDNDNPVATLEQAFELVCANEALQQKVKQSECNTLAEAVEQGVISEQERKRLQQMNEAVSRVVAVDHFSPQQLRRGG